MYCKEHIQVNILVLNKILLITLFLNFNLSASIIVSDIDDTLRKTESLVPSYAIAQAVKDRNVRYEGNVQFINDLINQNLSSKIYYVSDNFREVYDTADWIGHNNLPTGEVYQREEIEKLILNQKNDFKIKTITKIFEDNHFFGSHDPIFFLGDNGYRDPSIYESIAEQFDLKNYKILIRDIKGEFYFTGVLSTPLKNNQELKNPNIIYFNGEKDFWFNLKYNDLVMQTNFLTWVKWYYDFFNKSSYSRTTSVSMANQNQQFYCKQNDFECINKLKTYYERIVNSQYKSFF